MLRSEQKNPRLKVFIMGLLLSGGFIHLPRRAPFPRFRLGGYQSSFTPRSRPFTFYFRVFSQIAHLLVRRDFDKGTFHSR